MCIRDRFYNVVSMARKAKISLGSSRHVSTWHDSHDTFDVSSPCILAVSSLSRSTARHARLDANVSCRVEPRDARRATWNMGLTYHCAIRLVVRFGDDCRSVLSLFRHRVGVADCLQCQRRDPQNTQQSLSCFSTTACLKNFTNLILNNFTKRNRFQ